MFKFLLITGIVVYLIYKIGSFFFRVGAASQHFRQYQEQKKGNFNPNNGQQNGSGRKAPDNKVKGGEYIDYEEVK
jgi:hypothetical protein